MANLPTTTYYWRLRGGAADSWTEAATGIFDPTDGEEVEVVSVGASKPAFIVADVDIALNAISNTSADTDDTVTGTATASAGTNIVWSISGVTGATIDSSTGAYSIPTGAVDATLNVTITGTNGANSDSVSFTVTVTALDDVTVSIASNGSDYDVTLPEGENTINIDGTDYTFDTADLVDAGVLFLDEPTFTNADEDVSGDVTEDDTLTAVPPPYVWIGATPAVNPEWINNEIVVSQDEDYVVTASDVVSGLTLRFKGVNGVETTYSDEAAAYTPPEYTEVGLVRDGTSIITASSFAPDSDSLLMHINFEPSKVSSHAWVFQIGANNRMRNSTNGAINNLYIYNTSGEVILNFDIAVEDADWSNGDRVDILFYANKNGDAKVAGIVNGVLEHSVTKSSSLDGSSLDLDQVFYFQAGANNNAGTENSTVYDLRAWLDLPFVDVTDPAVYNLFVSQETGEEGHTVNPAIANLEYGTPYHQLDTSTGANVGSGPTYSDV